MNRLSDMAQKVVIHCYSRLSDNEVGCDGTTVRSSLEGTSYETDLTASEQQKLRYGTGPLCRGSTEDWAGG